MGTKFDGATNVDLLRFAPEAIETIIRPANLSRAKPESDESIRAFAERIAAMGQHTPVTIRRDNEGNPVLVSGNRRIRAIHEIINANPSDFLDSQGKPLAGPLPLVARFIRMTEDQALAYHLSENEDRLEPSVIDRANAARTLSEVHQWDQERIGGALNCSASRVSQLLALLELPGAVLRRLEAGTIREATAKALRGVSAELVAEHLAALDRGEKPANVARDAKKSAGKRVGLSKAEILTILDALECDQAGRLAACFRGECGIEDARLADFPPVEGIGTEGVETERPRLFSVNEVVAAVSRGGAEPDDDTEPKNFICANCLTEAATSGECESCGSESVVSKAALLATIATRPINPNARKPFEPEAFGDDEPVGVVA